jgi:hypothetical protein
MLLKDLRRGATLGASLFLLSGPFQRGWALLSSGYLVDLVVNEFGRILPVALIALTLAVVGFGPLVRRLGTHPLVATGLLLSAATIAVVTLTKAPYALGQGNPLGASGFCLRAGWQPDWVPWPFAGFVNGRSLNVWMFTPVGLFAALTGTRSVPGKDPSPLVPAGAIALGLLAPLCIEAAQRTLPLARLCDSRDVADNTYGMVIGAVAGLAIRAALQRRRRLVTA